MSTSSKADEGPYRLQDMSKERNKETFLTHLAFGVFGFVIYATYSVLVSAAQDALRGTLIPTSVIIAILYVIFTLTALFLPYFADKIPQVLSMSAVVLSIITGLVMYAVVDLVLVRLAGAFIAAIGQSLAEVGNVSLSALYNNEAMAWFSLGTGLGLFIGPLYFTGMTTLACVSPETTLLIFSALPLAYLLMYAVMDKTHYSQAVEESSETLVDYTEHHLNFSEKLALMKQNGRNVFTCALGFFVEYLSLTSTVTTLAFQDSPFDPRDHYVYYVLCFTSGEFIGRSYISLFASCKSRCSLVVKQTWILAALSVVMGILLGFATWYRFLPSVVLVFLLAFAIGVSAGMLYINTILFAAEEQDFQSKMFSRGFSLTGMGIGCVLATLLGFIVEPALRENCVKLNGSDEFCFTRSMNGWNSTSSCLT